MSRRACQPFQMRSSILDRGRNDLTVPIPAYLRIIPDDDFAMGCFHRARHGVSFFFFLFSKRGMSNQLTYLDSCTFANQSNWK